MRFADLPHFCNAPIVVSIAEFGQYNHHSSQRMPSNPPERSSAHSRLLGPQAADALEFAIKQRLIPVQLVMINLQHVHAAE